MPQGDFDYNGFFRRYAQAYEKSLLGEVQVETIRSFFADSFLALAEKGGVKSGRNDDGFEETLRKAYEFYRAIGTRRMHVERVEVTPIAAGHDSVRVFYAAGYQQKGRDAIVIPFHVVYLIQQVNGEPKIFAFIAGDEMTLYRQHGLVDDEGMPRGA